MHAQPAVTLRLHGDEHLAVAGVYLRRVLALDLFRETLGPRGGPAHGDLVAACHDRWTDLASTLAALPTAVEGALVVASVGRDDLPAPCTVAVLVFGRGDNAQAATAACAAALQAVTPLLTSRLDYATLWPIHDQPVLDALTDLLGARHCLQVSRRLERFEVVDGDLRRAPLGFDTGAVAGGRPAAEASRPTVPHLFPWAPSDDDWRGLLDMLVAAPASGLVVRFRGFSRAPEAVRQAAHQALHEADALVAGLGRGAGPQAPPSYLAEALRTEILRRVAAVEGRVLGLRVFVASADPPHEALVATVLNAIDDASVAAGRHGAEALFRGGADVAEVASQQILAPLHDMALVDCFGPREAAALLRTPMPSASDLPGVPLDRARTAPMSGVSGADVPLGVNGFRGRYRRVALDGQMRDRHVYVVGQTGSGKSTLLANMIVHDIRAGRGVVVLDPHGSLVDEVLPHVPRERCDDLLVVDVNDVERPVGFNLLRIDETEPAAYRRARDLVIDDLHAYLQRNFDHQMLGPVFESHFRAFMGLLMGVERPPPALMPNFALFRLLYLNSGVRRHLARQLAHRDFVLEAAVAEAESSTGESSLSGTATYVTSKFTRFITDEVLRNLTCQTSMVDFDDVIARQQILLIQLGRGRIGDVSAGLLASMVISRLRLAVMKRGAHAGPPIHVYADEFQSFADRRMGELLAEARKFGLRLTLAHQFAAQLPPDILQAVLGNVGTVVACRVGAPDAESLERTFAPAFGRGDLVSLPNFQAYVRSLGCVGLPPFSVMLPPPLPAGDADLAEAYRQLSRLKHGRHRTIVEEEFRATYRAYMELGESRVSVRG